MNLVIQRDELTGKRLYSDATIAEALGISVSTVCRTRKGQWADRFFPEADVNGPAVSRKGAERYLEESPPPKAIVAHLYPPWAWQRHQEGTLTEAEAGLLCEWVPEIRALYDFELFNDLIFEEPLWARQRLWFSFASDHRFSQINMFPRAGKSNLFSVRRTVWRLCGGGKPKSYYLNPRAPLRDAQVMIVQRSEEQARSKFLEVAAHLVDNRGLLESYGRFKEVGLQWQESKGALIVAGRRRLHLSGDYSLVCMGARSSVLGRGATDIIADDPFDQKNTKTPEQAEDGLVWLRTEVFTRLEPDGVVIVLGAKLPVPVEPYTQIANWPGEILEHMDEADYDLPDPEEDYPRLFATLVEPAVLDWENKVTLVPERWPWDKLMAQMRLVGSVVAAAMYMQNPEASGAAIARRDWVYGDDGGSLPGCLDHDRKLGQPMEIRSPFNDEKLPQVRVMSLDSSQKRYWAAHLLDIPKWPGREYRPILLDLVRDRLQVGGAIDLMKAWHRSYQYRVLVIEENNAAHLLGNEDFKAFIKEAKPRIRLLLHKTTGQSKPDPHFGMQSLGPDFKEGRIRIPHGDTETRWRFQYLIKEALGELSTDDCLASLWFPKWNLQTILVLASPDKQWQGWGRGAHQPPPARLIGRKVKVAR